MIGKKFAIKAGLTTALAAVAAVASTGSAHAAVGAGWVGWGETNNSHAVWCVQKLIDDSPSPGYATTDGAFGQQTYTAIQKFQRWAGLPADGVVGPSTGDALLLDFSDYYDNYCYHYLPTTY
ncbi:peptidoglycan-binding domain-containing protein [Amycolatopsis sp. Hca4]|uniref:peptidoglycan-binding domain-containing protein n=1 Tax=unclassified Amycolatopsis TaxID=2618356 RepID=UPI001592A9FD|nr:peptidoglycan-binding domain-containing protein [Amycolatopsis sp. Hca4]QKV74112.1 peptidoglycan-binding protein [Amycolatopsis sp. Hca4]